MRMRCNLIFLAVHPHGRGDNRRWGVAVHWGLGSPPRAWGQYLGDAVQRSQNRFTPTGVGTIGRCTRPSRPASVHPHGRGDNRDIKALQWMVYGSPPRAWGQLFLTLLPTLIERFTPTGVGTMSGTYRIVPTDAVHPHGRGDNLVAAAAEGINIGSPPRAWGQFGSEDGVQR